MSVALNDLDRFCTREEYRLWCASQPKGRFERVDGRIVAMSPERIGHARTKVRVWQALDRATRAAGIVCEVLPDGVTVETGESDYEPDALVNCGPPMDANAIAASNPVIIVELLSPGTTSTDTGGKLAVDFEVCSIMHYLIVHSFRRSIIHHRRTLGGIDTKIVVSGDIVLDPLGITITVEDIYPGGGRWRLTPARTKASGGSMGERRSVMIYVRHSARRLLGHAVAGALPTTTGIIRNLVTQRPIHRTPSRFNRPLGRIQRVPNALPGMIDAPTSPLRRALLLTSGQPRHHQGTGSNQQRYTHGNLIFKVDRPNGPPHRRFHSFGHHNAGTA